MILEMFTQYFPLLAVMTIAAVRLLILRTTLDTRVLPKAGSISLLRIGFQLVTVLVRERLQYSCIALCLHYVAVENDRFEYGKLLKSRSYMSVIPCAATRGRVRI